MKTIGNLLCKHWQIITVLAGVVATFLVVYLLRGAFLPFLFGLALVYFLIPVVSWVERRFPREGRWVTWSEGKRVSSIMIVNTGIIGITGLSGFYLFHTIVNALTALLQDAPAHYLAAVAVLQQWTESVRQMVPPGVRDRIDLFVIETGTGITASVEASIRHQIAHVPSTVGAMLGFFSLPLFLFYLLKDREKLSSGFYSILPPWSSRHVRHIILIIQKVLGRWVRATLTLGLVVGLATLAGLLAIGAPYAPMLAVVAGVTEMIPVLGPWIGGAIAVVVTLALASEKVVWVVALAAGIQLLEAFLLVPRIQGGYLGIHPAMAIILIVVGSTLAGVWGMILFVPLAVTALQIYRYARKVVREQEPVELPD